MENSKLDYGIISKRRDDLFGISILTIMFFHYFLSCQEGGMAKLTADLYISVIGRTGVAVFLILSGIGLFFSMSANPDLKRFYRKRVFRVLIPYLIVQIIYLSVNDIALGHGGIVGFLKDITFVSVFTDGDTHSWFIALILIMYLVFPLLFKIFKSGKHNFLKLAALVSATVLFTIVLKKVTPELYYNIEVMITRIPAFIIGAYLGEKVYNKRQVGWQYWAAALAGSAAYLYFTARENFGDARLEEMFIKYSETVYALLIIMVLSIVLEAVNSAKLSKILAFFGSMSLELYMVHIVLRSFMQSMGIPPFNPLYYLIMLGASVGISYFLAKLDTKIMKKAVGG